MIFYRRLPPFLLYIWNEDDTLNNPLARKLNFNTQPLQEEQDAQPLVRVRRHSQSRTESAYVRYREAGFISPLAIVGFVLAMVMICLVLYCHIRLDSINEQQVAVVNQLDELQTEYKTLAARYEQIFDMEGIEKDMTSTGAMLQPTSEQVIYLDLSQPDSAVTYAKGQEKTTLLGTLLGRIVDLFLWVE